MRRKEGIRAPCLSDLEPGAHGYGSVGLEKPFGAVIARTSATDALTSAGTALKSAETALVSAKRITALTSAKTALRSA